MCAYTNTAARKAEQFKEEVWKSVSDFQDLIGRNRVMMFSSTHCPYCKTAKVCWTILTIVNSDITFIFSKHLIPLEQITRAMR